MKLNFYNIQHQLHTDHHVIFQACPVGGHHIHGKVERKIREIKKSMEIAIQNERLSILNWETLVAEIANSINDLPLALGNVIGEFESMDLLTPNRLLFGRNNARSPAAPLQMTNDPSKLIQANERIFEAWFEVWMTSHVPKLMTRPKWFTTERHLKVGDVIMFNKHESQLKCVYRYGIVKDVNVGKDGCIREAVIRYRNDKENGDRETNRAVRKLVVIHPVDELSLYEELSFENFT